VALLVVIVGPIASGKSTVASSLAARLRHVGWRVAELDLDDVVEASGTWTDMSPERFRKSQIVFGQLVAAWLAQGFYVIAHGPLFEPLAGIGSFEVVQ
jgi:adenylylsulfate kinase-like enzyme